MTKTRKAIEKPYRYITRRSVWLQQIMFWQNTSLSHIVRGVPRPEAVKFSAFVLDDSDVEIIWVDEFLHRRAVSLLQQRADKSYSLCDAVSFIAMRELGIIESLTTDKHFEQEGFTRLLAS